MALALLGAALVAGPPIGRAAVLFGRGTPGLRVCGRQGAEKRRQQHNCHAVHSIASSHIDEHLETIAISIEPGCHVHETESEA